MNVVMVIVDSLRGIALDAAAAERPATPFLDAFDREAIRFRRAYATECWTLPSHASMFTGLLPSQHGAHLQTMRYEGGTATIAETLAARGYRTELITRNSVLDGSIPGITRGFQRHRRVVADVRRYDPMPFLLALTKPRFRRQIRETGFFHPRQRDNHAFVRAYAEALLPADEPALTYALERMADHRRAGRRFFLALNLYDVHAPYCPVDDSMLAPLRSFAALAENAGAMAALPHIGRHEYLRSGFALPEWQRHALLARYHRSIELMDGKLERFHRAAHASGLLDDTLLIIVSDHGEAFGEHGLYLHDASVYDLHLRVPLWIRHPDLGHGTVEDVVSTRDLATLVRRVALDRDVRGTLLDAEYRNANPFALAEHYYYPHVADMEPRFRCNLAAAVAGRHKAIVRGTAVEYHDLSADPGESSPTPSSIAEFASACRAGGLPEPAIRGAVSHLRSALARERARHDGGTHEVRRCA